MSDMKRFKGTLTPIYQDLSKDEAAKKALSDLGLRFDAECYSNIVEQLEDDGSGKFMFIKDKLYKVEKEELSPYKTVSIVNINKDGVIEFEALYYSRGAYLEEVLRTEIENLLENIVG